ncbi:MAG: hypothetical protein GVY33_00710 [Alphaproteobacteria bacterium]|jgi:glyoxylate reductase|nr:hypothetical protein [Alphaproteobacteria bacterium]
MSDPRLTLFVTRRLPPAVTERLVTGYDARVNEDDHALGEDEIRAGRAGADGVIAACDIRWDAARLPYVPENVEIATTFSVGFEPSGSDAAAARGLRVGGAPAVATEAVADIAVPGPSAAARRARDCGREIRYHHRRRRAAGGGEGAVCHVGPATTPAEAGTASSSRPAKPATRAMVAPDVLAAMAPWALLVKTARDALVDPAACTAALDRGPPFAAGRDLPEGPGP